MSSGTDSDVACKLLNFLNYKFACLDKKCFVPTFDKTK